MPLFSFVVKSEAVRIGAPAEVVWRVLLDAERYGEWAPFTTRIETDFKPGSPIRMQVVVGGLNLGLTEYIREVEPPTRISWGKDFGARWLLTAKRTQFVDALDESSCSYHTTDKMSGLVAPIVKAFFAGLVLRGFDDTGHALKSRAEALFIP